MEKGSSLWLVRAEEQWKEKEQQEGREEDEDAEGMVKEGREEKEMMNDVRGEGTDLK